jgi:uncharacterized protein
MVELMSIGEKKRTTELPETLRNQKRLAPNDAFCFGCHKDLPCFTTCCRDVTITLTPVDILRLSRRLQVSTTEFLNKHTLLPITKELHLPVIILKMSEEPEKRCPFVDESGCTVYEDRPWSCRMYPLGMGLPPARAGVEPEPLYFLFEDDFCKGAGEKTSWSIDSWKKSQGVTDQEEKDAGFREIVSHPWFIGGQRQLDPKRMEMFHTAFYDLDTFRRFIFSSSFLKRFDIDERLVERLRTNDDALLGFASRWLRFALFKEPTLTIRDEAARTDNRSDR